MSNVVEGRKKIFPIHSVTYLHVSTNGKYELIFLLLLLSMCVHTSESGWYLLVEKYCWLSLSVSIMKNRKNILTIEITNLTLFFYSFRFLYNKYSND
jgi:type III secretory pathway component EscU